MNNKKEFLIIALALIIVFSLGGYYLGLTQAQKKLKTEKDFYENKVKELFPPPSKEIKELTGKIIEIVGATFYLEAKDPTDYQGFLKNQQQTKIFKVDILNNTPIILLDYRTKTEGEIKNLEVKDLKKGDNITIFSEENILNKDIIKAARVQIVLY